MIIVHTGIVARAESEGQLAGVLAHEVARVTHRHQIRKRRELQNQQTAVNVAAFLGALALAAAAVDQSARGNYGAAQAITTGGQPLLALGLNLTYAAMVSGYSRDIEREADQEAIRMMVSAGYSATDLAQMFRHMLAEGSDRGSLETFFWGSHPRLTERIETVEEAASKRATAEAADAGRFERDTARVRVDNAMWDAYVGRWRLATMQVDRVLKLAAPSRRSAVETLLYAHLYTAASTGARSRQREEDANRSFEAARARYDRLISSSATADQARAYRGLGELYFAHREYKATQCDAKTAYRKYLELEPTAKDTEMVEARLAQLHC